MTTKTAVSRTKETPSVRDEGGFVSRETFEAMRTEMLSIAGNAVNEAELARESLTDLMLAMDNIGWKPLSGLTDKNTGPRLDALCQASERCRTVVVGNPIAQHGVEVRRGYIWGTGIEMRAKSGQTEGIPQITKNNQRSLFSQRARNELEMAAATDGNVFMVLDKTTKTAYRVPLEQISTFATDSEDTEQITHFLRKWTTVVTNSDGKEEQTRHSVWYPVWDAPRTVASRVPSADGENSKGKVMIHAAFNTMSFWHFGLPDLYNVLWWIASYKEYIEAGFSVTRALAKFAIKASAPTKSGAARAGANVATPVPVNGSVDTSIREYGKMANLSGGSDINAINKSGAEFDFTSGRTLAAYIAAGLHIDVDVLLAENKVVGDIQLSTSTTKAMIARQGEWDDFLTNIATYFGVKNPNIRFPPVRTVAVHRAIQAVILAATSNTLWQEEIRGLMIQMLGEYGVEESGKGLPPAGNWALYVDSPAGADEAGADQPAGGDPNHPGTKPLNTPKGAGNSKGKKTPAGPLANGDNALRDKKE